jgi:GxxExxY protein
MKTLHRDTAAQRDELSGQVIASAIEVHRHLGPGLLETVYESALSHELKLRDILFKRQVSIPAIYKGVLLEQAAYRLDMLVEDQLIVEVKAVEELSKTHSARLLTYLRLTGYTKGLLLNFNCAVLKDGIKRLSL